MEYEHTRRGVLRARYPVGQDSSDEILFQAMDIRKSATGVHAHITIAWNTGILDEDVFNVGRLPDRNRLANSAHKALNGYGPVLHVADLQHQLMLFCRGLWDEHIGLAEAERRPGTTDRQRKRELLAPYIRECGGTILFAAPGKGKSWTGLLWAVSVDAGLEYPWPTQQGPALYVNLERDVLDDRLGDVNAALGLERERPLLFINKRGSSLAAVAEPIARAVEREGIVLVTLDSLSRAGLGNLNDNDPANNAMDILNSFGCAWVALGHTPREDESHLFGSQMFDAAPDLMVQLLSDASEHELGVGLKVTKVNDGSWPPPQQWCYSFDADGLQAVLPAEPGQFGGLAELTSVKDRIKAYLLSEHVSDATDIAQALGIPRTTVASALADHNRFYFVGKEGRKSLYALLTKAM